MVEVSLVSRRRFSSYRTSAAGGNRRRSQSHGDHGNRQLTLPGVLSLGFVGSVVLKKEKLPNG